MAQNTDNEKLKQHALREIAEGREEISAEVHRLRQRLSPVRVVKRVVDRHAVLLVALAVTAGIIPALLIFRGKRSSMTNSAVQPPPKPMLRALLVGAVGLLARSTPFLIKAVVMPHVQDYMAKRQPGASAGSPQV
jgi:hypothetical protein